MYKKFCKLYMWWFCTFWLWLPCITSKDTIKLRIKRKTLFYIRLDRDLLYHCLEIKFKPFTIRLWFNIKFDKFKHGIYNIGRISY